MPEKSGNGLAVLRFSGKSALIGGQMMNLRGGAVQGRGAKRAYGPPMNTDKRG
jgi:hypothetical protein